ncbi:hypothetical protein SAMN04490197_0817 [Pseudomonas orientalis]|uniref:Uncharacterized protein n=1 Tax=Pseudomonas orientalis TaxID=76758 RepID=A0A8B3XV88_9PSED|nr:hypothetical protein SAMN04490197_0817 [Pseudomonas orientalis]
MMFDAFCHLTYSISPGHVQLATLAPSSAIVLSENPAVSGITLLR